MTYEELLEFLKTTGLTDQQIAERLRNWQDQKEYHSQVRDYYTKYPAYYSLPFDASIQVNPSEGVRDWYDVRQNPRNNNKITIQTPTTFTTERKHGGVLYKYYPQHGL